LLVLPKNLLNSCSAASTSCALVELLKDALEMGAVRKKSKPSDRSLGARVIAWMRDFFFGISLLTCDMFSSATTGRWSVEVKYISNGNRLRLKTSQCEWVAGCWRGKR